MKIIVRHPDSRSGKKIALHAEKLLSRVLDGSRLTIDQIKIKLKMSAGVEGQPAYHCNIAVKLHSDDFVRAETADSEGILAVYRAVDKVIFLLEQRLKSVKQQTRR